MQRAMRKATTHPLADREERCRLPAVHFLGSATGQRLGAVLGYTNHGAGHKDPAICPHSSHFLSPAGACASGSG